MSALSVRRRFKRPGHLGSTAVVANSSGGKTGELRYYAWGETRYAYGTTPTAYRYTGQRLEAAIGLYYYRARWYDPALGRFISADTIVPDPGNPQDLNRYAYVRNNPLRYTDPSGHRLAYDPEGEFTWTFYDDNPIIVEAPETVLNEWERRYANYVLTGNEGFFPGEGHALMYRNIDYTLAVLGGMGLGPGVPEGSGIWG
ncbi:MAG: hypothetical protein DRI79_13785, partial [Chloroflexi bacterium]